MSPKSFLPLIVTILLASAAAANASGSQQTVFPPRAAGCRISMQQSHMIPRDRFADTEIGGLADVSGGLRSPMTAPRFSIPARQERGLRPLLVAALEMIPSGLANDGPASCYPPLSLVTTSVPVAKSGTGYSTSLAANGGQPPYRWSFGQSSLPPGFSIDPTTGTLTGTPAATGTYIFNVVVSDSLKNNQTGALALLVTPSGIQPPPTNLPPTNLPPTNLPPTNLPPQPPVGPATGTKLTACGDITNSGTYYLANDVSSAGTCFGIDANGITLNLNGHTITYGTGGGTTPTPAIEGHDCWYTTGHFTGGYCGSAHGGAEVYGGTIIQSPNSAAFSPVFSFGQGSFNSTPSIHDITAMFQNQGAQFYYSSFLPPGAKIENNTIYDNVTNIQLPGQSALSARSQFQGYVVQIIGIADRTGAGDTISDNRIVGGPQGGLVSDNQNTMMTGNDVSMNATTSNDYCFEIAADSTTVSGNNCHPVSGRGVDIDASSVTVANNILNVTELKQNVEYSGCELGGAYGIRTKIYAGAKTATVIEGNAITATAGTCRAIGIEFTLIPAGTTSSVTGNTITSVNLGQGAPDYGLGFDSAFAAGIALNGNTVNSMTAYVLEDWDGSNGISIGHNTWAGNPTFTVDAEDGSCIAGAVNAEAVCPVSIVLTDTLPVTVKCYSASEASIVIGGTAKVCNAK